MERIDFSNYLFRCSGAGSLMAYKEKNELPKGAITALKQIYKETRRKRREEIKSKYLDKGNMREEDSITLWSRVSKMFYKKNDQRVTNFFLTGNPDLFIGPEIMKAEEIDDIKSSWSAITFPMPDDDIDDGYYWQLQGYMAITGAKRARLVYCLVNCTYEELDKQKRWLKNELGLIDETGNETYLERAKKIEQNLIYDYKAFEAEYPGYDFANTYEEWCAKGLDIPKEQRVIFYEFERNDEDIMLLYKRIKLCRDYLNNLDEQYCNYFTTRLN